MHISTSLFRSRFDPLHVCRGSPFTHHVTWKALRHMPTSHCTHTPVLARAGSLQSWHAFCPQRSGRISSSTTQLSWLGSMKVTPGVYKQHTMCTHLQGIRIYTVEDTAWTQHNTVFMPINLSQTVCSLTATYDQVLRVYLISIPNHTGGVQLR